MNLINHYKKISFIHVILRQQRCRRNPINKSIASSLLFITLMHFSLSRGMEGQATSVLNIEDYYGTIFTVPSYTANKSEFLKNSLNFENTDCIEGNKRDYFDFEFDDVWDQLFNNRFQGKNTPKVDISFFQQKASGVLLSKETLETALRCIEQPQSSQLLSKANIRAVFTAINFLSPSKEKVLKKLTQRMKVIIPFQELNKKNEIDRIVLSGIHERSVAKLFAKQPSLNKVNNYCCDLSSQRLENLNGIAAIKDHQLTTPNICDLWLNVNNNKLYEINFEEIFKELPQIRRIYAASNNIKKIILPKIIPPDVIIDLSGNQLEEIPLFYLSNGSTIYLFNNPLNETARQNIRKAEKSTFLLRNKKLFKDTMKMVPRVFSHNIDKTLSLSAAILGCFMIPLAGTGLATGILDKDFLKGLLCDKELWKLYSIITSSAFLTSFGLINGVLLGLDFNELLEESYDSLPEVYYL